MARKCKNIYPKYKRNLTPEQWATVDMLLGAGVPYLEISERFGISKRRCGNRLRQIGLPPRHKQCRKCVPQADDLGPIEIPGEPTEEEIAARAMRLRERCQGSGGVSAGPARVELMVARCDRRRR